MASWRLRMCPDCGQVSPAGKFRCADYGENWRAHGHARRQCPACGYTAETAAFRIVRPATPRAVDPKPAAVATPDPAPEPDTVPWWAR